MFCRNHLGALARWCTYRSWGNAWLPFDCGVSLSDPAGGSTGGAIGSTVVGVANLGGGGESDDEESDCETAPDQPVNGVANKAGQCTPPTTPVEGRPCSSDFMDSYLDYDDYGFAGNQTDPWAYIGGSLGMYYGNLGSNSCAARLSCGLNGSGAIIPFVLGASNLTFGGANAGVRFIISAEQLRSHLNDSWGASDGSFTSLANLRGRLAPGQAAIVLSNGHAAVVTNNYNDAYVTAYGGDIYILPTCE